MVMLEILDRQADYSFVHKLLIHDAGLEMHALCGLTPPMSKKKNVLGLSIQPLSLQYMRL